MKSKIFFSVMAAASLSIAFTSCDDDDVTINTTPIIEVVETGDAVVTSTTAQINGRVTDLSGQDPSNYSVGVYYALSEAGVQNGTRSVASGLADGGNFTVSISGLNDNTTYYYASYVTLNGKLTVLGDVKSFLTTDAVIATSAPTGVSASNATLNGQVNGADHLISAGASHGFVISTDADHTANVLDLVATDTNPGTYSVEVTGLVPSTGYYATAWAEINGSRVYGEAIQFTTAASKVNPDAADADYVDMGTKVDWAKYDVGAEETAALGGLYVYGDPSGLVKGSEGFSAPKTDINNTASDIAVAGNMGNTANLADFEELLSVTDREWTEVNGVKGMLLTSRSTGNTLFFPAAGILSDGANNGEGVFGAFWTGAIDDTNTDYAKCVKISESGISYEKAPVVNGLSVRPVRKHWISGSLVVDNPKIVTCTNGSDLRIEIYNEYGSTKENCGINLNDLSFSNRLAVTFKLSGVTLKEGAANSYIANISYATPSWWPFYWGSTDQANRNKCDAVVTGDGTYTVWYEPEAQCDGAVVFTIDIKDMADAISDISAVKGEIVSIQVDQEAPVQDIPVMNDGVLWCNKDGNGVDGRIQLAASWDSEHVGVDASKFAFPAGTMTIEFTLEGIDGNLKPGATKNYPAEIGFAAGGWWPSSWSMSPFAPVVSGDGTYTVQTAVIADSNGIECLVVDLPGLWADLEDVSKVKATVNKLYVPAEIK